MIHCGTLDDVFSYEKMKHERGGEEPPSPHSSRLTSLKTMSFRRSSAPQSPPPVKLGGNKKSSPFRWISQLSDGSSSKTAIAMHTRKESTPSSLSPRKKMKEPSRRIGFVDIILGYHTLLQASPGFPITKQRKELYPTIGFIQNPDYEAQKR